MPFPGLAHQDWHLASGLIFSFQYLQSMLFNSPLCSVFFLESQIANLQSSTERPILNLNLESSMWLSRVPVLSFQFSIPKSPFAGFALLESGNLRSGMFHPSPCVPQQSFPSFARVALPKLPFCPSAFVSHAKLAFHNVISESSLSLRHRPGARGHDG